MPRSPSANPERPRVREGQLAPAQPDQAFLRPLGPPSFGDQARSAPAAPPLPAFLRSCPRLLGGPWREPAALLLHCRLPRSGLLPPAFNASRGRFGFIGAWLPALGFLPLATCSAKNRGLVPEQNCPAAGNSPQGCTEEAGAVQMSRPPAVNTPPHRPWLRVEQNEVRTVLGPRRA